MGKISNTINHYLSDNRRFADLFNGICFQGEMVVRAEDLSDGTQVYYGVAQEPEKTGQSKKTKGRKERTRDICKKLKNGGMLRILAVENQRMVDYAMPYRCMEYDVMEYGKQIDILRKKNRQKRHPNNITEKLGGIKKTDRLTPVYTICLYHGVEIWDGPRTLGDMMDFGDDDGFRNFFKDYPMQLYCLNEEQDLQMFHTELGLLFQTLHYRKDRDGLRNLMEQDERFRHIDVETLETISVMLEKPSIWNEREKYLGKNGEDEEEYDMCQALEEWAEEERSIGREEGRQAGFMESRRTIVRNMLIRDMSDADIMAIAECDQEFVDNLKNKN